MYILGINAFHGDSAACLLRDGRLIAAVEEERFRRIKHWAGFPSKAVQYCLDEAGIGLNDVEHIAVNSNPKAHLAKKISYSIKSRPDLKLILDRISNKKKRANIAEELKQAFPNVPVRAEIHHIEHHLSHLASAHLVSPFENSVVVSIDGFGDFSSAAWGMAYGSEIEISDRIFFPHSLGIFYQALTQFIGFPCYGDEYKVMGLAPYGKPAFMDQMHQIIHIHADGGYSLNLDMFRHHKEKTEYEWSDGSPSVGKLYSDQLSELFGFSERKVDEPLEKMHMDIAHSVQQMYEEAFVNLLNKAHDDFGVENLSLAGGCAMNSVANGKIYRRTPYKNVYVQSAAGDAGGAIGCAYIVASELGLTEERFVMEHAYWGPSFKEEDHVNILSTYQDELIEENCTVTLIESEEKLCQKTADAISKGLVIGWFQGRMEWGPRALGNRSILGDPRRSDMKDILNSKIKRRESFRPFAPSILRSETKEWFEEDADVPFMMQVFNVREEKRAIIPAVTHVDGSGRLQTVTATSNARYHTLIAEFGKQTGVPIVLNTSFNENEPVVCKPEEAIDCFLRTKMDILVLGDYFIQRN